MIKHLTKLEEINRELGMFTRRLKEMEAADQVLLIELNCQLDDVIHDIKQEVEITPAYV